MVWGAIIGAAVSAYASDRAAKKSAKASTSAAGQSAEYQMAGLDYLKESEAAPMFYRDQALSALASEYGLTPYSGGADADPSTDGVGGLAGAAKEITQVPRWAGSIGGIELGGRRIGGRRIVGGGGGTSVEQFDSLPQAQEVQQTPAAPVAPVMSISERAMQSPLYAAIMSGRDAGEQSIARSALATGGLRTGQSIDDLTQYNTDLQNRAFLQSRADIMSGLGSMAGLQSMAPQIAQQYTGVGETLAAGRIGAAQARQQGYAGVAQSIGQGIQAYNQQRGTV